MKVLGLDLGVASIGWALIDIDENNIPKKILGMGSRIINLRKNEANDFSSGKGESVCSKRTSLRTMRKCYDRYQLRRQELYSLGLELGMIDKDKQFPPLDPEETWALRSKGATPGEKLTPSEIVRVLIHINQRRGYRHSKSDVGSEVTDYVSSVNQRFADIKETGLTVGQFFYRKLVESKYITDNGKKAYNYRIREKVLPRQAYEEEFDAIMKNQQVFYPELLTDDNIKKFKNAIFFQRPLKSCKHLVSFCEFERKLFKDKNGKIVDGGPRVAPITSPLSQVERIYEVINNIRLINPRLRNTDILTVRPDLFDENGYAVSSEAKKLRYMYTFDTAERERIFEFMSTHEKMTETDLLNILGLKKSDGYKADQSLGRGLQGNTTYCKLAKALEGVADAEKLLKFDIQLIDSPIADEVTGEVYSVVSPDFIEQPLYKLWHTLYSVADKEELRKALAKLFGITDSKIVDRLYSIDFVSPGYANKSTKFMRKLIPLLMQGFGYAEASAKLGINHSQSITKEENELRELKLKLELLPKNSLRQPTVEKILNQMINLVNAVKERFGDIDEVRVELARELKQSKEERSMATKSINSNERENQQISEEIMEFGIQPSRRRIQKMKMLRETGNVCIYCGQPVTPIQFIEGHDYEIEHIIPRSKIFNDSFSNKVCACRECNKAKNNRTAYDFMESRPELFEQYINRINDLYKQGKISKGKYRNLNLRETDIDAGFIDRDLRLTQYISRKARLILMDAFRNVYASSGAVTDFFRHSWGYDTILHDLNLSKYERADLTEEVSYSHHGQTHRVKRIKDWSKRKDHRHHAIDALVVALTRQGYIQRLSTLNTDQHDALIHENIDKWACRQPHFAYETVCDAVDQISVSFKAGKKLTTPGKRYVKRGGKRVCVQTNILIPRDQLHKDTVYGKIKKRGALLSLAKVLEQPETIVDADIRDAILAKLKEYSNNVNLVKKDLKKNQLIVNGRVIKTDKIECYSSEVVVKYPIESITYKDIPSIIDGHIRELVRARFSTCDNKDKKFAQSLSENPIYSDEAKKSAIRSIRLYTNIDSSTLASIRKNKSGNAVGFAQTRNNHHLAFYLTSEGKVEIIAVSFWTAVKRKRYGIPIVVTAPEDAWDKLIEIENPIDIEDIRASLPHHSSKFIMSIAVNEMFVLGLSDDQFRDALSSKDYALLNKHLFRVQKLSEGQLGFSLHTSTTADMRGENMQVGDKKLISSYKAFKEQNAHKVRVNMLGEIIPLNA